MNFPDMILRRILDNVHGTFGVLIFRQTPIALTVEDRWRDNKPYVSCIPAGDYKALRCRKSPDYNFQESPTFGDTFQVMDVKDRSHILFHGGNAHTNTEGCIVVGSYFGVLEGMTAVLGSKTHKGRGYYRFLEEVADRDEFDFRIIDNTRDWV